MSTTLSVSHQPAGSILSSIDRADVTCYLYADNGTGLPGGAPVSATGGGSLSGAAPLTIAQSFKFAVSKPKTPINVLSQLYVAGFARDAEDKTFDMTELATFQHLEHQSWFTSYVGTFLARIVHLSQTDMEGNAINGASMKIIQLEGLVFEKSDYSVDAKTAEYTWTFSGRFTRGKISGDLGVGFNIDTGAINTSATEYAF